MNGPVAQVGKHLEVLFSRVFQRLFEARLSYIGQPARFKSLD
jgi:hypothetical protein